MDVDSLAELLRQTEKQHGAYEKAYAGQHWSDWYAVYLNARENGSSSEEATDIADRYLTDVLHILPL